MERFELELEKAKKDIKVADHMLNITYKLVDDPKILLTVMNRIKSALTSTMLSLLLFERMYKRIPPFQENFDSIFNTFRARCTRRYNINIEYITLIQDLDIILKQHKKSPVEFSRKGKFVICSEDYRIKVLSLDKIKGFVKKAKLFIQETQNMIGKYGRSYQ